MLLYQSFCNHDQHLIFGLPLMSSLLRAMTIRSGWSGIQISKILECL